MIAKLPLIANGNSIALQTAIADYGWSQPYNLEGIRIDLLNDDAGLPDALCLSAYTRQGQGDTPTSPGAGKKLELQYAFHNALLDISQQDILDRLQTRSANLDCLLPDSSDPLEREHATGRVVVTGRYLYVWRRLTGWASADALVDYQVFATALR